MLHITSSEYAEQKFFELLQDNSDSTIIYRNMNGNIIRTYKTHNKSDVLVVSDNEVYTIKFEEFVYTFIQAFEDDEYIHNIIHDNTDIVYILYTEK